MTYARDIKTIDLPFKLTLEPWSEYVMNTQLLNDVTMIINTAFLTDPISVREVNLSLQELGVTVPFDEWNKIQYDYINKVHSSSQEFGVTAPLDELEKTQSAEELITLESALSILNQMDQKVEDMMSDSNNQKDLDYQVIINLRGDLPLEERHKDGIARATKAIEMIQNIKNIDDINDILDDEDLNRIRKWCKKNGICIPFGEWNIVQGANNKETSNHPIPYSIDPKANYSFDKDDGINLNYRIGITMHGDLPLNERNEDALTRLSKYPDIIQQNDVMKATELLDKNDIRIDHESRNNIRLIGLSITPKAGSLNSLTTSDSLDSLTISDSLGSLTTSEEEPSTEENPSKLLKNTQEKNPVNTSENQEEYTIACTII